MHFSTHQSNLNSSILKSLSLGKLQLIAEFIEVLNTASRLFKTDQYGFWLHTLESVNAHEIPVTKYGHCEALRIARNLEEQDRNAQQSSIEGICETLFSYSSEDDLCEFQSDFHYYCIKATGEVFKISGFGVVQGGVTVLPDNYRIAYLSELNIAFDELYL